MVVPPSLAYMAEAMKQRFNAEVVKEIAATLPIDRDRFVAECLEDFDALELTARGARVADVMHRHLDSDPATAVNQVSAAIGPPLGFGYFAHSSFIATYGLPAFEESMAAQHSLTQVFTSEFCIRPFIVSYPATMDRLREWTADPSEHVRRLVSEGTRPRLPWATRLPAFQADPTPVIELLDLLKDDPAEYVRRSVGNNLNDISRDSPEVALAVAERWGSGRGRLIRRGLRTLIKAGDARALSLLGYDQTTVTATAALPRALKIGAKLPLTIELAGNGPVLVDIRVHFVKANGTTSPKVFRGAEVDVVGVGRVRRTISFAHHSTRRPFPGPHRIEALINGTAHELGTVEVLA